MSDQKIYFPPPDSENLLACLGVDIRDEHVWTLWNLGPKAMHNDLTELGYSEDEQHEHAGKFGDIVHEHIRRLMDRESDSVRRFWNDLYEAGYAEAADSDAPSTAAYQLTNLGDRLLILVAWFYASEVFETENRHPMIDPRVVQIEVSPRAWEELLEQGHTEEELQKMHDELMRKFRSGEAIREGRAFESDDIPDELVEAIRDQGQKH